MSYKKKFGNTLRLRMRTLNQRCGQSLGGENATARQSSNTNDEE